MVIQRSWKLQSSNENLQHSSNNNSSDDSNGSNQTVSSSNTNSSKSQNIRYVTTPQMAENILFRLRQRFSTQITGTTGSSEALMRSLELLRINVQLAFDKEIDTVVKKFMEMYFNPAFKNIKENLGENVISDDVLQKMACALLENSKAQYNTRLKSTILPLVTHNDQNLLIKNEPNIMTVSSSHIYPDQVNLLKRPIVDIMSTETIQQSPMSKKPLLQYSTTQRLSNSNSSFTIQSHSNQSSTSASSSSSASSALPMSTSSQQIQYQHQYQRRQIFWNTANISNETKFLLDVQANQAFGFGTDGRERLASKHPELIRYLPDGQDRDWLVTQKIIPEQNRNSRFLFLIYDEVVKLGQSDLYRNKDNLNLNILHAFKIPNFIIQKMKIFFIDLNIKSRGLITNSYSALIGSNHLRNALLQGSQNTSGNNNANNNSNGNIRSSISGNSNNGVGQNNNNNNSGNNNNNNLNGNSHNVTTTNQNCISSSTGNNNIIITSTTTPITNNNGNNDVSSVSTTAAINSERPKLKSTLSSSHATLTALLNQNTENTQSSGNNGGDTG